MHAGVALVQQTAEASPNTPSEWGHAESEPVKLFAGQHILGCFSLLLPAYHFQNSSLPLLLPPFCADVAIL